MGSNRNKENEIWRPMIIFISPDRMENNHLIKQLCFTINNKRRKLFTAITREEILKNNKINDKAAKENKKNSSKEMTPEMMASMIESFVNEIEIQAKEKNTLDKKVTQKGPSKGKSSAKKGASKNIESPSPKTGTTLKKRGEEGFETKTVDDEPEGGPSHYIIVQGIENVEVIQCLFELGLSVHLILKLSPESQNLADQIIALATKFTNPPAPEIIENENIILNNYWEEIKNIFYKNEFDSLTKNILQIDYIIDNYLFEDETDLKEIFNNVFDSIANIIYRVIDLESEHKQYLDNITVTNVEEQNMTENFNVYRQMLSSLPIECVSVPFMVHCIVEQVVLSSENSLSPEEIYINKRGTKLFSMETANIIQDMTKKLGLSRNEIEMLQSKILPENKFEKMTLNSPEIINFGDDSKLRFFDLKDVDVEEIRRSELYMLSLLPECRSLSSNLNEIPPNVLNKTQELFKILKNKNINFSESDRILKSLMFESMNLSSVDYSGCLIKISQEGFKNHIPWDFPFYNTHLTEENTKSERKNSTVRFKESSPQNDRLDLIEKHRKRSLTSLNCEEYYNKDSLMQIFSKLVHIMPEIDILKCQRDGSVMLVFSAPCNHEMLSHDSWNYWLHSKVGLRNYSDHVSEEIAKWTEEQKLRQINTQNAKIPHVESDNTKLLQKTSDDFITDSYIAPDSLKALSQESKVCQSPKSKKGQKCQIIRRASNESSQTPVKEICKDVSDSEITNTNFNGYDFGNHFINVNVSLNKWYPVEAGILKIMIEEHLMGDKHINVTVNVNDITFIVNNKILKNLELQDNYQRCSTILLGNGFNCAVEFTSVDDISEKIVVDEANNPSDSISNGSKSQDKEKIKYLRLSSFTSEGLYFQVEQLDDYENSESVIIRQSIQKYKNNENPNEEYERIFYKCGIVMKKYKNGEIICYDINGNIYTEKQIKIARLKVDKEENRKRSTQKSSTKRKILPNDTNENVEYDDITEWTVVDFEGNKKIMYSNGDSPIWTKLNTLDVVDPKSGQKMITREDGTIIVILPDGTHITEFADNTRIAFYTQNFESNENESGGEFVEFVKFEHPNYANILFNRETNSFVAIFPDETSITYTNSDGFNLQQDSNKIRITPQGQISYVTVKESLFVQSESTFNFFCDSESPLAQIVDSDKNSFTVSPQGECKVVRSVGFMSPDSDDVQSPNRRYFIINPDKSGYELIPYCDIEELINETNKDTMIYKTDMQGAYLLTIHRSLFDKEDIKNIEIIPPGLKDRDFRKFVRRESILETEIAKTPSAVIVRKIKVHKNITNTDIENVHESLQELNEKSNIQTSLVSDLESIEEQNDSSQEVNAVLTNSEILTEVPNAEDKDRNENCSETEKNATVNKMISSKVINEKLIEKRNLEILRNRIIPSFFDNEFASIMLNKSSIGIPERYIKPKDVKSRCSTSSGELENDDTSINKENAPSESSAIKEKANQESEFPTECYVQKNKIKLPSYFQYSRPNNVMNKNFIELEEPTILRTKNISTIGSSTPQNVANLQGLWISKNMIDFGSIFYGVDYNTTVFVVNRGTERLRFKVTRPTTIGVVVSYTPGIIFPGLSKEIKIKLNLMNPLPEDSLDIKLEIMDEFRISYLQVKAALLRNNST